ncbi:MAG: ribosome-associated translation inhibitor RaiA [Planctomycetales bacterium]
MQVVITCKHGSISKDTEEHLKTKSGKLLTYFERVTSIDVTVSFDKDRAKVEILVDAEHKHNFVASQEGDNVIHSFDQAFHKMEQQIKKYKEKIQNHRRDLPDENSPSPVETEQD